jgi:hypothetical protein
MDGPRRAALHIDHLLRSGNVEEQPGELVDLPARLAPELERGMVSGA